MIERFSKQLFSPSNGDGRGWHQRIAGRIVQVAAGVVIMSVSIGAAFDPSAIYYNSSNGNFGLGTDVPQTYLHLKNTNPIITLMTTSAGQTIDNNGTNNGWLGLMFMAPSANGGTAQLRWDITYSARDRQLYFFDYLANRKTLMIPDGGTMQVSGGLTVVSGNVGIGTTAPDAMLHAAKYSQNTELLAAHFQNLGGGSSIVTVKIGEGTPENQYGVLGHYGADNSFRIGAVGPSGNHNLQFHTGNSSGTQLTSERMRITYDGKVGIGTMVPQSLLHLRPANIYGIQDGLTLEDPGSGSSEGLNIVFSSLTSPRFASIQGISELQGNGGRLLFSTNSSSLVSTLSPRLTITASGNIGIGTTAPLEKLHISGNVRVDGTITAQDFFVSTTGWADYVFEPNYSLRPLSELAEYVKNNKHLPDVPSESDIKSKGINVAEMQQIHMKKIEELTLYVIQLKKQLNELNFEIKKLKALSQ
ncbi:hypothetical protein EB093_00010 [bacterium]|nr:hypothetical protein [bacterium]